MGQTTTVITKKIIVTQRYGKVIGRKELKIQRFLLTGEAPYVKKIEKKGR